MDTSVLMSLSDEELQNRKSSYTKQDLIDAIIKIRKSDVRLHTSTSTLDDFSEIVDRNVAVHMTPLHKCISELLNRFDTLQRNYDQLQSQVDDLKKQVESKEHDMTNEVTERISRRSNIIIAGFPECSTGSVEERHDHDMTMVKTIGRELGVSNPTHVASVKRIGKVNPNKPRLIRVQCSDYDTKIEFLQKSKMLKSSTKFKSVFINPDYTSAEREINLNQRKELKRRKDAGEDVVLYRGKITLRQDIQGFRRRF